MGRGTFEWTLSFPDGFESADADALLERVEGLLIDAFPDVVLFRTAGSDEVSVSFTVDDHGDDYELVAERCRAVVRFTFARAGVPVA